MESLKYSDLPNEIIYEIMLRLDLVELKIMSQVNRKHRYIYQKSNDNFWKKKCMIDSMGIFYPYKRYYIIEYAKKLAINSQIETGLEKIIKIKSLDGLDYYLTGCIKKIGKNCCGYLPSTIIFIMNTILSENSIQLLMNVPSFLASQINCYCCGVQCGDIMLNAYINSQHINVILDIYKQRNESIEYRLKFTLRNIIPTLIKQNKYDFLTLFINNDDDNNIRGYMSEYLMYCLHLSSKHADGKITSLLIKLFGDKQNLDNVIHSAVSSERYSVIELILPTLKSQGYYR